MSEISIDTARNIWKYLLTNENLKINILCFASTNLSLHMIGILCKVM